MSSKKPSAAAIPGATFGVPGSVPGDVGTGEASPVRIAPAPTLTEALGGGGVASQDFGTSNHVFTTARVNAVNGREDRLFPFRATGKLFFNIGADTFVCSASLIRRGVIVTAAHCVANFGASQFYSNWVFVPAYNGGVAPYGVWNAPNAWVMTSYLDGTEACAVSGVVCPNDVAVIELAPQSGAYAGARTGFYGYGWDGVGFTPNPSPQALISQLGYPVALDGGELMERTDSQSYRDAGLSNNNVIGSEMTGGSSGGPWLVNLGVKPVGYVDGAHAARNVVVGVTSWGYTGGTIKEMGASPFTRGNIVTLVRVVCGVPVSNPACR